MSDTTLTETPASPAPPPERRGTSRITLILAAIAVLAIGFVGGIFTGMAIGGSSSATAQFPGGGTGGMPGGGELPDGGMPGGDAPGVTSGTVVTNDGTTIVIETSDGEQRTVTVGGDTAVTVTEDADASALQTGDEVTVIGESADDGSIAADTITEGGGGFPGGAPGGAGTAG